MSFEIGIEIQCFDDNRHKLCNRPMHNDMTFRLGRMKITNNVYSYRSVALSWLYVYTMHILIFFYYE